MEKGRRRPDLELSARVLGARTIYAVEGCAGCAAEMNGKYLAILDQGTLAELDGSVGPEGEDVRGGISVYEFDTAEARDAFLDERCRGMHRLAD